MAQRSLVWEHFDVNPCDQSHATCKHCSVSVSRGGRKPSSWSTSTLRKHLSRRHTFLDIDKKWNSDDNGESPNKKSSEPEQQLIAASFDRGKVWDFNDERSLRLHRRMAEMVALDDQPFSVVNNEGFRRVLQLAEPRYPIPSDSYLRQTAVPDLYASVRQKVIDRIQHVKYVSFTTDTWTTSMSSESLISLTSHWIDDSWTRRSAILQTSHVPGSHTAVNIKKKFEEMLEAWSLADKVSL